ncbi:unnamed protein product [Lepidochelys olivacea]
MLKSLGPRMERGWGVLMMLGVAVATTTSSLPQTRSYEVAVSHAVDLYNQKAPGDSLFRLLEADPQPGWDENSQSTQELNFLIKETVCPVSEKAVTEQCDFKEDGLVRDCSGYIFPEQQLATILITCDTVAEEPTRVRRSRFGRFFKKVRKQLGRVLRHSRITLGGRMRF